MTNKHKQKFRKKIYVKVKTKLWHKLNKTKKDGG